MRRSLQNQFAAALCVLGFLGAVHAQPMPNYLGPPGSGIPAPPNQNMHMLIGDLNLDGRDDVVLSTYNGLSVLLTTNTGQFGIPSYFVYPYISGQAIGGPLWTMSLSISLIGDFNRDGFPDIACASPTTNYRPILTGNGAGQFAWQNSVMSPTNNTGELVAADLDLDGFSELICFEPVAPAWTSTLVHIVVTAGGNSTASTSLAVNYRLGMPQFADVTGDGLPDLVALARFTGTSGLPFTHILVAQGTGSAAAFGLQWLVPMPTVLQVSGIIMRAADLDGNGAADIICNTLNAGSWTTNIAVCSALLTGGGWWTMPSPGFSTNLMHRFRTTDVNGDGLIDIMGAEAYTTGFPYSPTYNGRYGVAIGTGNGQFLPPMYFVLPTNTLIQQIWYTGIGDIDGDGDPDLIYVDGTASAGLRVARNRSRFGTPSGGTGLYSLSIGSGLPTPGNSLFGVTLTGGVPNSAAQLVLSLGTSPAGSASPILVDLVPASLVLPAGAGLVMTNALGMASIPLPIPNTPVLTSSVVFGQWGMFDPATPGGLLLSAGATFIIW